MSAGSEGDEALNFWLVRSPANTLPFLVAAALTTTGTISGSARSISQDCALLCSAGSSGAEETLFCTSCAEGKFSSSPGEELCRDCPKNHYQPTTNANTCKVCKGGKVSAPGSASCRAAAEEESNLGLVLGGTAGGLVTIWGAWYTLKVRKGGEGGFRNILPTGGGK